MFQTCARLSCRQATNANPLDKILHGSVGYLTPRSGGITDQQLITRRIKIPSFRNPFVDVCFALTDDNNGKC